MCRITLMDTIGHNSGTSLKLSYESTETAEETESSAQKLFELFTEWKRLHDLKFCIACFFEENRHVDG